MKSLSYRGCFKWLPDEIFLKVMFRLCLGYPLNLKNPKTFNEKLQWLKLYNRNPLYSQLVDKYEVRSFVADKIGKEHLIPLLGVWNRFDEIDFSKLPNAFVLKCTHDSGNVIICRDKSKFDKTAAKKKIENSLKRNYYWAFREWPYKNVTPRIIAEQFMEVNPTIGLPDYKIFCFNGEPKIWFSITNRSNGDPKCDYFDLDGNHLPFVQCYKNSDVSIEKPSCLGKMFDFAKVLTADIPLCRVDFYEVEGQVYFGELTFFESGGFEPFCPSEWDYKLGKMIKLQMK
jgi:hypothetical protein